MATYGMGRQFMLAPGPVLLASNLSSIGNPPMDADGEKLAIKIYPDSTSGITDVDLNIEVTGDLSGINFTIQVETDNADAPSDTVLGAATAAFSITADGFTGLKTLATPTGNLTVNTPVWVVLQRTGGNSLSGTNFLSLRGACITSGSAQQIRHRHHNGTNWTTTTAITQRVAYALKHSDNSYSGLPIITGASNTPPTEATDIHGAYRHGLRFKVGSQCELRGFNWLCIKAGSPNNLIAAVFEGSTLKHSVEVAAANLVTGVWVPIWFTSPILLAPDTNLYIILGQEDDANDGTLGDDGGDDSNDYDSRVITFSDTYRDAVIPPDFAFVYGNGNDPTALTVSNTDYPMLHPIIVDPASDFDQAAGGGASMMSGVMRGMAGHLG